MLVEKSLRSDQIFFYAAIFFLLGVALGGILTKIITVSLVSVLIFILIPRYWWLSGFILLGFLYFHWHDFHFNLQISELNFVKDKIINAYHKLLPLDKASFLSGLTLGEKGELSSQFLDNLSKSGTRHLIALSGLHLLIITRAIHQTLKNWLPKKKSFYLTFLFIFSFVAMTGFKVSAIRAAFMALILNVADLNERIYSPRNAIALAGLILILLDPNLLIFDVGFQLSFAAVIGIVVFTKLSPVKNFIKNKGVLNWRENLAITASAQLAVAPLIWYYFGQFSVSGFVSNILILPVVPITMVLGYITGASYYLFQPIAVVLGWMVEMLINYQMFVINLFAL